jgi:hypothetical protein
VVTVLAIPYLRSARTIKETTMMIVTSGSAFAVNRDEWISYSHWGMFPVK